MPIQYPPSGLLTQRQAPGFFEQQKQKDQQQQLLRLKLQELRSQIGLRQAQTKKLQQPEIRKPTRDDVEFYIKRGYTKGQAKIILDKRYGLEKDEPKTPKELAMELGRWQSIYNKTREVGVLGQFGDIHDPETAKLAEQTIADLRTKLITAISQAPLKPQPLPPTKPEAWKKQMRGLPPTKFKPEQMRPLVPKGKVKVVNPAGETGYIPANQLEDALKQGFKKAELTKPKTKRYPNITYP